MNAAIFLVLAVHEIAISTKLAITAGAAEKPDTNTLTYRPSLHTGTKSIDPSDNFMAWDARPIDGKHAFYRSGIRVADTACLDPNAYLIGTGITKWFFHLRELSRSRDFNCFVCCAQIALFRLRIASGDHRL